jgi:hypothetical protein
VQIIAEEGGRARGKSTLEAEPRIRMRMAVEMMTEDGQQPVTILPSVTGSRARAEEIAVLEDRGSDAVEEDEET